MIPAGFRRLLLCLLGAPNDQLFLMCVVGSSQLTYPDDLDTVARGGLV